MKKNGIIFGVLVLMGIGLWAQNGHAPINKRTFPNNLAPAEAQVARVYQKVISSVVTIYTTSSSYTEKGPVQNNGLGSGVLISGDCHILTAAHVVDGSTKIEVKTTDGKLRKATILFSEKSADIALLKLDVPDRNLTHATLGDSDIMAVGQNVYAIGSPYGMENSFSSGIVSAFRNFNTLYDGTVNIEFIQTDAAINQGNSGGPLFNSNGEVVGIASSILTVSGGFQGIGMAVTSNTVKGLLAFEDRPWIGIEGVFLKSGELAKLFNLNLSGGLLVQKVGSSSPADKAGLKGGYIPANIGGKPFLFGGDIILKIGPQDTCHVGCLEGIRKTLVNKEKIDVRYLREGKEYMVTLDVSEVRKNFLKGG
ncbi:S1C family serine protease [Maribacter sp. 2304DJ31-5]|uniref:S1C family serine protease n=1 Tax=Maribacter sp. 2304DJ31-5 TaxID=3386273 RepID=UPI0039BD2ACF